MRSECLLVLEAFGRRKHSPLSCIILSPALVILARPWLDARLPIRNDGSPIDNSLCPRRSPMNVSRKTWVARSISKRVLVLGPLALGVALLTLGSFVIAHP